MIYKIHLIFKTQTLQEAVVSAEYLYCFILSSVPWWEWAAGQAHAGTGTFPGSYCCTPWDYRQLGGVCTKAAAVPHQRLPLVSHQPQGDFTGSAEQTLGSHGAHAVNHVVGEAERNDFRNFKSFSLCIENKKDALSVLSIIKEYQLHWL